MVLSRAQNSVKAQQSPLTYWVKGDILTFTFNLLDLVLIDTINLNTSDFCIKTYALFTKNMETEHALSHNIIDSSDWIHHIIR